MILSGQKYYLGNQEISKVFLRASEVYSKYIPAWELDIKTTQPNQVLGFFLWGNTNTEISWGDTSISQISSSTTTINKTYASVGDYKVKIYNQSNEIYPNSGQNLIVKTSTIPQSVGSTNLIRRFQNCSSLSSVPIGVFDELVGAWGGEQTFENCTSLRSIPSTLFEKNINLTDISGCFRFCTSLSSIPSTLFQTNTAIVDFGGCFEFCTSLSSIPFGLFDNNIIASNLNICFGNCTSLTNVPEKLFDKNLLATFSGTFRNCTSLTNVPSSLFYNNTASNTFLNCFQGVTLTTTSYSNLLINMASNAASRLNNVSFGGGNSKYNTAGQTARNTLIAKGWTFVDGGLE